MKYHKLHPFLPALLTVLFFPLFSPPVGANEWSMTFRTRIPEPAADKGFLSFDLKAGMGPFTTDGYDGAVDVMALPAGPLQAVFSHEGDPAYPPHLRELWTDIRSDKFPQSWTIRIRSMQNQFPVQLEWSPPPVFQGDSCGIQSIQLTDETTGLPVDLSGEPAFSYPSSGSIGTPEVREFTLTVIHAPRNFPIPPPGFQGRRRGHVIKLKWQRLNDPLVTGVRVWRRAEGELNANLLTPEPLDQPGFVDRSIERGMTYFYSISAVGSNGCESPRSNEIVVYSKSIGHSKKLYD